MYMRYATAKVEKLEKDLKESKSSEKAKDREVDEAWTKMRFAVCSIVPLTISRVELPNQYPSLFICTILAQSTQYYVPYVRDCCKNAGTTGVTAVTTLALQKYFCTCSEHSVLCDPYYRVFFPKPQTLNPKP